MLYHADMESKSIGKRIALARAAGLGRKVTQAELANFLAVTPQAVSGWERGEAYPEAEKLTKIALFLGVSIGWLLGEEGDDRAPRPDDKTTAFVRLVDKVPAGKLAAPMSQLDLEDLPLLILNGLERGEYIALTVDGDSMDRISPDGSVIVVNKSDRTLVSGKPYVFCHRGRVTFKLWRPDPPRLQPHSTNPIHEPIYVKDKADAEKFVVGRVKRTIFDL
jgi:transcriptional regulator with XRE-family HTH domain